MVLNTKYNPGDFVWFIDDNKKIKCLEILGFKIDFDVVGKIKMGPFIIYRMREGEGDNIKLYDRFEDDIFKTKERLLINTFYNRRG